MSVPTVHIWQSVLQGDKAALEQLMQCHYKVLYNYGLKFTPDAELVKDCIQELFTGIWDRRSRLSTEVNPRAYLIASLRRALHRKIVSENRISKYHDKAGTRGYFNVELSVEDKIIHDESLQLLAVKMTALVAALPRRQQEVVYLKFFQELSRDEIAKIMGNNPQTVSNLLQLALKKLRSRF